MFTYKLIGYGRHDQVTVNADGDLKFEPPVYEQRYLTTLQILEDPRWSEHVKKVVEFGCNDMKLLPLMRRVETLEHIMQVDIDEEMLVSRQFRGVPLTADFIKQRNRPLRIEIFRGNIIHSVDNLRHMDAVIGLELIEHLEQDVLDMVPSNIFGFIQPKLAIFSTPNREYNVLFNNLNANGFRIDDHKFEWTRKEFRNWAGNICKQYPNYSVSYLGIGRPPPNRTELGHVTQMAIFARNDIIDRQLKTAIQTDLLADKRTEVQYKEIYAVDFPHYIDERTTVQKIKDETINYLSRTQGSTKYYNAERYIYQIPLKHLNEYARSIDAEEEDFLNALKELDLKVEDEFIILTEEYVDENYRKPCSDLYDDVDDEEFLSYENFHDSENYEDLQQTSVYVDDNEPEECWD